MSTFMQPFARFSVSRLLLKIALLFVVLAAVPLLLLGGVTLYVVDLSHRRDVANLETQLIAQKSEEVEKFFADTIGVLELRVGYTQKSEIAPADQRFLLEGLLAENEAFEEVRFITLDGRESARLARSERGGVALQDVSELPQFRVAAAGSVYLGDVHQTLEGPTMTLAAPVRNRSGDIVQVLAADVSLRAVRRLIEGALLGTTGYVILLDSSGRIIAEGGARGPVGLGADLSYSSRVKEVLGGAVLDGLGERDRYASLISDVPVAGAGARIERLGWAVLAEWPIEDADTLVRDVRQRIFELTLVSIIGVLLIAPIVASRLVRPIRSLERGAAAIAEGKFETRVAIATGDELEELGGVFNRMAVGLKRLQELRDEFVFVAAHELRAPVTAIRGYTSMVLDGTAGAVSEKVKGLLEPVQQASNNLVQLVNDLLEIARADAGRIEVEVFSVDIRPIVEETVRELVPLGAERGVTLRYDAPPEMVLTLTDIKRFREVVTNLVSNAIKYNRPNGSVTISHEMKAEAVTTHVADTGFGIPEAAKEKIFEKFFRVKSKETSEVQGTGLGLFIVKQLVEKMNGKIWVVSKDGEGTTFSVSLPAAPPEVARQSSS
jgi:signal transduction histidine kinase